MSVKRAKKKDPKAKKKEFTLQPAILGALRRLFRRWPPYITIKNENKKEYFVKSKKGKPMRRVGYICNICGKLTPNKDCAVDHKIPCVCPNEGFVNLDKYAERLFCEKGNLQILCKKCHDIKSKEENKQRRISREKKKPRTEKETVEYVKKMRKALPKEALAEPKKAPPTKRKKK